MADQLYLSLWFPNFRLQSLPAALVSVLRQFAIIARDGHPASPLGRVTAASAYPIDWTESPVYQRLYRSYDETSELDAERAEDSADIEDSMIENAVAEATEQLHEDTAYEFEMRWMLWQPELDGAVIDPKLPLETAWRDVPTRVRITGFGPGFDEGSYEQNGHIRIDFGLDTPWTFEDQPLPSQPGEGRPLDGDSIDRASARHIRQNVEKLLAFTLSVEKHCNISSRLLWTESGEPLAEKLIARLQRLN